MTGLDAVPGDERPPVQPNFQAFHAMVLIGLALIGLSAVSLWCWWRGTLERRRWLLWALVLSVLGPQIANQLGWFAAEVGRQPWIVYGLLRTSESLSRQVTSGMVLSSLIMFGVIYLLLFALFIYLLDQKIRHGPGGQTADDLYGRQEQVPGAKA